METGMWQVLCEISLGGVRLAPEGEWRAEKRNLVARASLRRHAGASRRATRAEVDARGR